jgi:hypothetical protein
MDRHVSFRRKTTISSTSSTRPLLRRHNSHASTMSSSSHNSVTPIHNRQSSDKGSLKTVLNSFRRSTGSEKSGTATPTREPEIPLDPLPTDPRELEGLLNRQLSALDHLQRTVIARNDDIKNYGTRAVSYYELRPNVGQGFLKMLDVEMRVLKEQRDAFVPLVRMRHEEIVRIAEWRKKIDEERGMKCTVYEMYLGFLRLEVWEELFSY